MSDVWRNPVSAARQVLIHGRIDRHGPVNVESVRRQLRLDEGYLPNRVHLEIDCAGGDIFEAERIFALLRSLQCPVEALVSDRCHSAAIDILLAADLRLCHPHSRFLLHNCAAALDGDQQRLTATVLEARAANLRRSDTHGADLLFLRTGHDRSWFVRTMAEDREIDAMEAVSVSLVHGTVGGMRPYPEWPAELKQIRQQHGYVGVPVHLQRRTFLDACVIAPPAALSGAG